MNRRDRRALARDVVKRNTDLHGRARQIASSSLARELLNMRAAEGTVRDADPRVIARDETGTVVEKRESGLLAVKTSISRGAK